jgi:hypothetical protein
MKIADRTPYRKENGQIDLWGRIQGTLKYGLTWFARLQAQDIVIAALDKVLDPQFILLRNVTLHDTDIDLPMVLIGPPGVYLINAVHERGVYRARDDEWGPIAGDSIVPASVNQIQRAMKLGRVLQIYLDRAGYKGNVVVEPILMAADPGMHVESIRPNARVVMSDAIERFAITLNQAPHAFGTKMITELAKVIMVGPRKQVQEADQFQNTAPFALTEEVPGSTQTPDAETNEMFSEETLGFSFEDRLDGTQGDTSTPPLSSNPEEQLSDLQEAGSLFQETPMGEEQNAPFQMDFDQKDHPAAAEPGPKKSEPGPKKKRLFGMTNRQVMLLLGLLLFWVCIVIVFAVYVYLNFNA